MESTPEFRTLKRNARELEIALKGNITPIICQLEQKGLVQHGILERVQDIRLPLTQEERAGELVRSIEDAVKLCPGNFYEFVKILNEEGVCHHFGTIIQKLRSTLYDVGGDEPSPKKMSLVNEKSPIVMAVENGDRQSLIRFVREKNIDLDDAINDQGETLLHLACSLGYLDVVRTLVEVYNCDLQCRDIKGNSPFYKACLNQQIRIISYLCHSKLKGMLETMLDAACRNDSVDMLKFFFCYAILANTSDQCLKLNMAYEDKNMIYYLNLTIIREKYGRIALSRACEYGSLSIVKFLFSMEALFDDLVEFVPSIITLACKHRHYNIIDYVDLMCQNARHLGIDVGNNYEVSNGLLTLMTRVLHVAKTSEAESGLFFAVRRSDLSLFNHLLSLKSSLFSPSAVDANGDTLLHAACVSGDLAIVEKVYSLNAECIDKQNKFGTSCLHVATGWGFFDIIKFLIKKGCNLNIRNNFGETPFHLAIINDHVLTFDHFLKLDSIDINAATNYGETPLHLAASTKRPVEYAGKVLAHTKCTCINVPDSFGNTPIFKAVSIGDKEMVQLLINEKCDLLSQNLFQETVFHIACRLKMTDILDLCFDSISDTMVHFPSKLKSILGCTLLHVACRACDLEMINYLINQHRYSIKDDINVLNDAINLTPLQYACMRNDATLFNLLVQLNGCDPDSKNREGYTVLHICCKYDLKNMARLCFEHCSFKIRNKNGDTPLHLAISHGNFELALELIANIHGTKRLDDYFNSSGYSVLHTAVKQKGAVEIVKSIITEGVCACTCKTKEERGDTALHIACQDGSMEYAQFLFSQPFDEDSQYNNHKESPLYCSLYSRNYDFVKSIIPFVSTWQLQHCCIKHFGDNLHPRDFMADVPLLQCLLWAFGSYHVNCTRDLCNKICDASCNIVDSWPNVITMLDSHGCSVLHYLARGGCKTMERLFDKVVQACGGKIDQLDKSMQSALHVACQSNNEFMIYKLLECESGYRLLHQKNCHDKTPSDLYRQPSSPYSVYGCVAYLASYGADIIPTSRAIELNKTPPRSSHSVNIIVVGNSSNGKTTLVRSLKAMLTGNSGTVKPTSISPTTGIVTDEVVISSNKQCFRFCDFAGHVEFEASHSKWLESLLSLAAESTTASPIVFLLLVKGTDSCDENGKQIERWFSFLCRHLKSTNKSVKLALLCSHNDCFQGNQQEERERGLLKILQHLAKTFLSNFNVELNQVPFFLNCRQTDTIPLNALLRYLDEIVFSCKLVPPNFACLELKHYLENQFQAPCQIRELIDKSKECNRFVFTTKIEVSGDDDVMLVPHEVNKLVELLKQLHLQNVITMLMPSTSDVLSWWIINKSAQNILFSEVTSIFSPDGFKDAPKLSSTHNTGVIPSSKLSQIFECLSLNIDLIENYLLTMGHCKVIEDKDLLNLIVGADESEDGKHFFFPGLIKGDKSGYNFPKSTSEPFHCGWMMESECDLGLRFLHSLLLCLTFKFSHETGSSKYSKQLLLWKCGLFWCTSSGINVLVEVLQDRKVVALFCCSGKRKVLLAKLRSEVINEIQEVLCKSISSDKETLVSVSYLYPPPTDFNNYEYVLSENDVRRPFSDMKKAFKIKDKYSRALHISDTETAQLEDILGFDSYVPIETSTRVDLLHGSDDPGAVLKQCFAELNFDRETLKLILNIDVTDEIHEKWLQMHSSEPLKKLCAHLDKYSIFSIA